MSNKILCADSYYASVQPAKEIKHMRLRFIGVVKTAKKWFPMKALASNEDKFPVNRWGMFYLDFEKHTTLLAFYWMDRDRHYFISTFSSLAVGSTYGRTRWNQLELVFTNAIQICAHISVPQPEAA